MTSKSAKQDEPDAEAEPDVEIGQSLLDLLVPEDEQDEQEEKRYDPRTRLVQIGELEVGSEKFACFIVDLSKKGTKIRTLEPLEFELTSVRLHISGSGVFDAAVRWVDGTEIGLLLQGEIEAPEDFESANIEDVLRIQTGE